jgi:acyl carrier protein
MERDQIKAELLRIFRTLFEIENPGLDEDLREVYEFDSIDAIELLREIEVMLDTVLTRAEKEGAMEIRTLGQIINYVQQLAALRAGKELQLS